MSVEQWRTRPLADVVRDLATAVADGQAELDRAVADAAREAAQNGTPPPTSYRFAEVDLDVQLELSLAARPEERDGEKKGFRPFVAAAPVDPKDRQREAVDTELTSSVRARLVPVPADRPETREP
jgi:hypothetical protein